MRSANVWQQHELQQRSAETQPHAFEAQGYASAVFCRPSCNGNGIPEAVITYALNSKAHRQRRPMPRRKRLRETKRIEVKETAGPLD
jgi:hypothetical protein